MVAVSVGRVGVAVEVAEFMGTAVWVTMGSAVGEFAHGIKGMSISLTGLRIVITSAGTKSGRKRTAATTARESRKITHRKNDNTRRPFFFLRRGLKTGNSPSAETSFAVPGFPFCGSDIRSIGLCRISSDPSGGGGSTL
jgi:hypothetical protein